MLGFSPISVVQRRHRRREIDKSGARTEGVNKSMNTMTRWNEQRVYNLWRFCSTSCWWLRSRWLDQDHRESSRWQLERTAERRRRTRRRNCSPNKQTHKTHVTALVHIPSIRLSEYKSFRVLTMLKLHHTNFTRQSVAFKTSLTVYIQQSCW